MDNPVRDRIRGAAFADVARAGSVIRRRLAVVGFGRLGRACATALHDCHDLDLAGVVRHGAPAGLAPPLEHTPVAGHLRELQSVDTALVMQRLFEVLIPRGHTEAEVHPGISLHHSAVESMPGVEGALVCERRTADGRIQHYVYAKLDAARKLPQLKPGAHAYAPGL